MFFRGCVRTLPASRGSPGGLVSVRQSREVEEAGDDNQVPARRRFPRRSGRWLRVDRARADEHRSLEVGAVPPSGPMVPAAELIDRALMGRRPILCPAGDRRHSLLVDPADVVRITGAQTANICQGSGAAGRSRRAIAAVITCSRSVDRSQQGHGCHLPNAEQRAQYAQSEPTNSLRARTYSSGRRSSAFGRAAVVIMKVGRSAACR